ncbi:Glycerol uptake facilitator protein [Grifola frondosa]|uniref:Glycerol uptake facilitator protein n=1 Tax=Grifola frondosa TaxID=5627 RepID=A0A1C7LW84_GRIFR|nr:Glycerol uptake facilitator protein [Grifola frondosa]
MTTHQLPRRDFVHLADIQSRPSLYTLWERRRHRQAHWLVECLAEFMGVFFYVYAGVGATVPFLLGSVAGAPALGSIFTIGVAYALGIALALIVCSSTSGGHFNPAVTIAFTLFKKFPPVLGAYIACLLIYVQNKNVIGEIELVLEAKGTLDAVLFTPSGPAGIFALYVAPGTKLRYVFLNEFVCDFLIGIVIWSCLDPTNFSVSPVAAPWVIGFTYAIIVWGYSPAGVATNAARDVGSRLMALTIWGLKAGGGPYAAIAALTNIPATLAAAVFYELVFTDSSRVITPSHVDFIAGHHAHAEHSENAHGLPKMTSFTNSSDEGKAQVHTVEKV